MTQIETSATPDGGKLAAIIVYGLYLLSIPSVALLVPVGLVIAYTQRPGAAEWVRTHFTRQIRLFWIAFWWAVALTIASIPAWVLTIVLIGFPLLWLIAAVGFIVAAWFTILSAIGLLQLLQDKQAG